MNRARTYRSREHFGVNPRQDDIVRASATITVFIIGSSIQIQFLPVIDIY